jgi:hypothetical protein
MKRGLDYLHQKQIMSHRAFRERLKKERQTLTHTLVPSVFGIEIPIDKTCQDLKVSVFIQLLKFQYFFVFQ